MTMDINIAEYLSPTQMQGIVAEEFRDCVRRNIDGRRDLENVIANAAYLCVWQAVDELMGEDAREAIARKIPEVIGGLSEYSVFRSRREPYHRNDSVAQEMLEDVVRECRPILLNRVAEMFAGLDKRDLCYRLQGVVEDAIKEWLGEKEADSVL